MGETDRTIEELTFDCNKGDNNSHLLRHAREMEQHPISQEDLKLTGSNYRSKGKLEKGYLLNSLNQHLIKQNNQFS